MEYLHSQKILYRDLKPENVLLDTDGNAKIADFGICIKLEEEKCYETIGTIQYMAPEIFKEKGYDFSVDIWAFGCLMYEMVAGVPPFVGNTDQEIETKIKTVDLNIRPEFSKDLGDLLSGLIHK